jgi:hypothetical protein
MPNSGAKRLSRQKLLEDKWTLEQNVFNVTSLLYLWFESMREAIGYRVCEWEQRVGKLAQWLAGAAEMKALNKSVYPEGRALERFRRCTGALFESWLGQAAGCWRSRVSIYIYIYIYVCVCVCVCASELCSKKLITRESILRWQEL